MAAGGVEVDKPDDEGGVEAEAGDQKPGVELPAGRTALERTQDRRVVA